MKRLALVCIFILTASAAILLCSNAAAQLPGSATRAISKPTSEKPPKERSPLRSDAVQSKPEPAAVDFCQCIGENATAAARIERVLRAPLHSTGLEIAAVPLQDVVTQISNDYGIPIQLDKPALDEAAIATDSLVDASLHKISLRSALRLILKRNQLTYVIQDEVLLITTNEAAEKYLETCVYDARKILPDASDKNIKTLTDAIIACIATDTWSKNRGGAAEIRSLPPGLLVITQTRAVQEEIRDLLATIQKMTHNRPAESGAQAAAAH